MEEDNFWSRVKYLMKKNQITQSMAAAACGVKIKTFQSWMYKDYYPTVLSGHALARLLGASVEFLVEGKEEKSKEHVEYVRTLLKKADDELKVIRNLLPEP